MRNYWAFIDKDTFFINVFWNERFSPNRKKTEKLEYREKTDQSLAKKFSSILLNYMFF